MTCNCNRAALALSLASFDADLSQTEFWRSVAPSYTAERWQPTRTFADRISPMLAARQRQRLTPRAPKAVRALNKRSICQSMLSFCKRASRYRPQSQALVRHGAGRRGRPSMVLAPVPTTQDSACWSVNELGPRTRLRQSGAGRRTGARHARGGGDGIARVHGAIRWSNQFTDAVASPGCYVRRP